MAQTVGRIEPVLDHPITVDPLAIESELARIWHETATAGSDQSSVLLRVVNFVGVGHESQTTERFERVMLALPERHPCRGILAVTTPGQQAIEASVSAHCWRAPGGRKQLCAEQVLLSGGETQSHLLASAVLALLIPELPVATWIVGFPESGSRLLAEIIDSSDRVFVDSADLTDPKPALSAALRTRDEYDTQVVDLAWCRIASWRGLVAGLFDGAEGARELAALQSIEIVACADRVRSEAMLLAGWFISRLDLTVADITSSGSELRATLYDGSRGVALTVGCEAGDAAELRSVKIKTRSAAFAVEFHPESGHMHVRQEWPDAPIHRIVAPQPTDDASIFMDALDEHDDPSTFADALRAAMTLLGE